MKTHSIDATGKSLGRLASEVAALLNGKDSVLFVKNKILPVKVTISNASKLVVTGTKMTTRMHKTFSGYPGGLKEESFAFVAKKKGYGELIRHAVSGMLPKNKLHDERMKNLSITE